MAATSTSARMPVVFLPHGGGPWPFVDLGLPAREVADLKGYLQGLAALTPTTPRALVVVSAHWEEALPTVMTNAQPPLLYDYYGFPPASYRITWPAPGAPDVADRVRALLDVAGVPTAADAERGFDHGTFIPLKLTFPDADVPTLQLSLKTGLDPAEHLRIGRGLAPLRDEGILLVGSGMTFHNLRAFGDPRAVPASALFDRWLKESMVLPRAERDRRLVEWEGAPAARFAHPREEHLLPLMVVAGAAGDDAGTIAWSGTLMGTHITAVHFGAARS